MTGTDPDIRESLDQKIEEISRPHRLTHRLPLTDLGNAERFIAEHKEEVRYVVGEGWRVWDQTRWRRDDDGEVDRRMKTTVRAIRDNLGEVDGDTIKKLSGHSYRSEADARIKAALNRASKETEVVARPDDFDADPWALNTPTGIVNLRTATSDAHDPARMHSQITTASYWPGARAPRFEQFLNEMFDGDPDLIRYVQLLFGYGSPGPQENVGCRSSSAKVLTVRAPYSRQFAAP